MKVIAYKSQSWFLLQNQQGFLFDVNVDLNHVSYSMTIYLTDEEIASYHSLRDKFLNELAMKLEQTAPIYRHRNINNPYLPRILNDKTLDEEITKTIVEWRKTNS